MNAVFCVVSAFLVALATFAADRGASGSDGRIRYIIETDAAGDPHDEQSFVRFLLYANEWDPEGIIANRARARDGENLSPERTGLGVRRACGCRRAALLKPSGARRGLRPTGTAGNSRKPSGRAGKSPPRTQ